MQKITSKKDLIRFIEGLPDDWKPSHCVSWRKPETVEIGTGYELREIEHYVEIRIEGPTTLERFDTNLADVARGG